MTDAKTSEAHGTRSEVVTAIRNLLKLGGSLGLTLLIGFVIRPLLRRHLGPDAFGPLDAADGFTITWFIVLGLGVDAYVRTEIPVRPRHANDFFASVLLLRLLLSVPVFLGMAAVLWVTGRPPDVQRLVYALGVVQFLVTMNNTLTALLQANTTIDGLSVTNVVSKALFAAGSLGGVYLGFGVWAIAWSYLASELLKSLALWWLCKKHLGLVMTSWGWRPVKLIVLATLPYYLNNVFHTVYNKIDVFMLSVIADERLGGAGGRDETAWYGAAAQLGGLSMLVTPLIGGVLMPLLARAREKNQAEYEQLVRRSLELILIIAIPISLALGVCADVWVRALFGAAYEPATLALRILSPIYVLIYVSIVTAVTLTIEGKLWQLAFISLAGLVANLALNALLVGPALAWLGPSGGGAACAAVQLVTELGVAATMLVYVGRRSFDARTVRMLVRTAAVCLAVGALDHAVRPLGPLARVALDVAAYVVLLLVSRAVALRETVDFLKDALRRRRSPA